MSTMPTAVSILAGTIIFIFTSRIRYPITTVLNTLISQIVNIFLSHSSPIKHVELGSSLPSLPYVFPNGQGNVEKFLQGRANSAKWETEHGRIYRLWAGVKGEVVLTKAAHVKAVFHDSHAHCKAHANDSGYLMEQLLGSCLGLINGQPWSSVKAIVEPAFLHKSMDAYGEAVQAFTRTYFNCLAEKHVLALSGKLHPVHDIKLLPFLFVAKVIYGPLSDILEGELTDLIPLRERVFKRVVGGGITRFAWSRFFPLPAIRDLNDFKTRFAEWNDRAHTHALSRSAEEIPPVIGMYEAMDNGDISREQLLQTLDEMLFANIDVTMGGLSWTLVFLAAHPAIQSDVRNEIGARCATAEARKSYILSSGTAASNLLGACILESARLRPLAAFSVPQSCPTARILDGFEIPAGTNFIVDSYALNIRDPFWGTDREHFIPERWLERQKSGSDLRYRYWRFGFGPRTCLGRHLADLILRTVVVEVLENWQISLENSPGNQENPQRDSNGKSMNMNWPWDDEMWIHHPNLFLYCRSLKATFASTPE